MAIYAFRESENTRMLVEFDSAKHMDSYVSANEARDGGVQPYSFRRVPVSVAHDWVRRGNIHETCLWISDGKIRRA